MKKENERLDSQGQLRTFEDLDGRLTSAFRDTSAIGLAILDTQQRFRFVNHVVAAMHYGVPTEAFAGTTVRDIMRDAAPDTEARLQRAMLAGETPAVEVSALLPKRTEPGYWIEKIFTIKGGEGRATQVASLAVEVTAQRKLEKCFRKLCGELLWRNDGYQRLGWELHQSINEYHAALAMSLDRLSRYTKNPERIPELLAHMEFIDQPMQKLASVVSRCFAIDQPQ